MATLEALPAEVVHPLLIQVLAAAIDPGPVARSEDVASGGASPHARVLDKTFL